MNDINWKIGGVGGMGAMGVGSIFSKFVHRSGYFVADNNEYNSVIKGGHNNYQTRFSQDKIYETSKKLDLLLVLDENSFQLLAPDLNSVNAFVICDWAIIKDKTKVAPDKIIDVPFSMLNKQNGGDEIMKNMIGLGASLAMFAGNLEVCDSVVRDQFGKKGAEIADKNIALVKVGYDYVKEKFPNQVQSFIAAHGVMSGREYMVKNYLMLGNEAIAMGALSAGIGFYAAYPMTPASSILHYLAPLASKYNLVVKHAEDEIAAINTAIGASFGGARAMVASAGGGFALMVEGLGLAAISETPIVISVISRPGPATGLPTWTDQADLRFVIHASQGEFLRLVFTPGDPIECFELTELAFELAEKYQIPVIINSDKYLAESRWSCQYNYTINAKLRNGFIAQSALDRMPNYERYADTISGVTPRSIPGMKNGIHLANSDEHDFYGLSNEDGKMRDLQINKRYDKKLKRLMDELPLLPIYGDLKSHNAVIAFGSVKNPILEAMKQLPNIKFLHINHVAPFPTDQVNKFLIDTDKFAVIENNHTGLLSGLITQHTGKFPTHSYLKDDGRQIYFEDLVEFLKQNGY